MRMGELITIKGNGTPPIKEVISNAPGKEHVKFTYTNGLIVNVLQTPDGNDIYSNYALVKQADGTYVPDFNSPQTV